MKQTIIYTLTALLLPFLSASCTEEVYTDGYVSTVPRALGIYGSSGSFLVSGEQDFEFDANEITAQTLKIRSLSTPWEIDNPAPWVHLSSTSGDTNTDVIISVDKNESTTESRMAILTLSSQLQEYPVKRTIKISQSKSATYITPAETDIPMNGKKQEYTVEVASNVDWTASSSAAWLAVSRSADRLLISAEENTSSTRVARIYLSGEDAYATIYVKQAEAGVTSTLKSLTFPVDGGSLDVPFEAEALWTATTSNTSWLNVSPSAGNAGNRTLKVTATANGSTLQRSEYVYIKIGATNKLAIPVSQDGIDATASPKSLAFTAEAATQTVRVTSNVSWSAEVAANAEWVSLKVSKGTAGETALDIEVKDNPNTTKRTADIHIYTENKTIQLATVNIEQNGRTFDDIVQKLEFPRTESTQTLAIQTDGRWTASTSDSWIHLNPSSGQGNGTIKISVEANSAKEERHGEFEVQVGQTIQKVAVVQAGIYMNVQCPDAFSTSTPASINVIVNANVNWTASSDADWLTVTPASGNGDAILTVHAADNPSVNSRTSTVTFTAGDDSKKLIFTQPGRTLSLDTESLSFSFEGGTSDPITVTTDGTFSISTQESWITIHKTGDDTFTVEADKLSGEIPRTGTVVVSLTGLQQGESLSRNIKVEQAPRDKDISCDDYDEDENWDKVGASETENDLKAEDYDKDEDWNKF